MSCNIIHFDKDGCPTFCVSMVLLDIFNSLGHVTWCVNAKKVFPFHFCEKLECKTIFVTFERFFFWHLVVSITVFLAQYLGFVDF